MLSFKQFMILREAQQKQARIPTRFPAVIVWKRKATRTFPNGQEVSEYYADGINKTFLFPNQY